jgi:hypothetical protein
MTLDVFINQILCMLSSIYLPFIRESKMIEHMGIAEKQYLTSEGIEFGSYLRAKVKEYEAKGIAEYITHGGIFDPLLGYPLLLQNFGACVEPEMNIGDFIDLLEKIDDQSFFLMYSGGIRWGDVEGWQPVRELDKKWKERMIKVRNNIADYRRGFITAISNYHKDFFNSYFLQNIEPHLTEVRDKMMVKRNDDLKLYGLPDDLLLWMEGKTGLLFPKRNETLLFLEPFFSGSSINIKSRNGKTYIALHPDLTASDIWSTVFHENGHDLVRPLLQSPELRSLIMKYRPTESEKAIIDAYGDEEGLAEEYIVASLDLWLRAEIGMEDRKTLLNGGGYYSSSPLRVGLTRQLVERSAQGIAFSDIVKEYLAESL